MPQLLHLRVVDIVEGDVGPGAKILDLIAVMHQPRPQNAIGVVENFEKSPWLSCVPSGLVDGPLRYLAHVDGLRLKVPKVLGREGTVNVLTCARVEREQVFFRGDFHVASSSHFFLHGCLDGCFGIDDDLWANTCSAKIPPPASAKRIGQTQKARFGR